MKFKYGHLSVYALVTCIAILGFASQVDEEIGKE